MKTGLYKKGKDRASTRVGLFIKVFIATLFLGVLGVVIVPKAEMLISRFFPVREVESLRGVATGKIFKDVQADTPNAAAIETLKNEGIIKGFSDGTFRPDDNIKREEFTKLVVMAMRASPHALSNGGCFYDVGNDWFAPYVCYAKRKQFVAGYEDGSFGVGKPITVAEGISMLNKAFRSELTAGGFQGDADLTRGNAANLLSKALGLLW